VVGAEVGHVEADVVGPATTAVNKALSFSSSFVRGS
jgi:hypothetical protein